MTLKKLALISLLISTAQANDAQEFNRAYWRNSLNYPDSIADACLIGAKNAIARRVPDSSLSPELAKLWQETDKDHYARGMARRCVYTYQINPNLCTTRPECKQ